MPKSFNKVPRLQVLKKLVKLIHNPIPFFNEAIEKYGESFITYLGGVVPIVVTVDPALAQHILQKNHKKYHKSKIQTKILGSYVGQGLLTSNGKYWLKQRRLIQPGFHKAKIEKLMNLMFEVIEEYTAELNDQISKGKSKINLSKEMSVLTLRIISKALFSSSIDRNQLESLNEMITELQHHVVKSIRHPISGWWRKLNGETKRSFDLADKTKSLLLEIIEQRKSEVKQDYDDMLQMLLDARYEDTGEAMTSQQVLDEILILFVAGHETTANALSWTFYLLQQNSEIKEKLIRESVKISMPITFDDIMRLDYSRQVISESMRIYPPAWMIDRVAVEEDQFGEYAFKSGQAFAIFIYGVHHSEKYWPQPKKFNPSRFSRENMKAIQPFSYFPFGGGPRL